MTFRWAGPGGPTVIPIQQAHVVAGPLHGQHKHGFDVVSLTTSSGVVEWRIRSDQLEEALGRIAPAAGR